MPPQANTFARVVACGQISQYDAGGDKSKKYGVRSLDNVVFKRILIQVGR